MLALPVALPKGLAARLHELGVAVLHHDARGAGVRSDGQRVACPGEGPADWRVVGSVPQIHEAAAAGERLWLRGQECGGVVGDATALVLIRAAVASGRPWVAEGLGERGSAAALALGAEGVVLDGLAWRAEELPWSAEVTQLLARLTRCRQVRAFGHLGDTVVRGLLVDPRAARTADDDPVAALNEGQLLATPLSAAWSRPGPLVDLVDRLLRRIEARAARARTAHPLSCDPLGTGRPVVQGPMANVAEGPALAAAVRAAGGLPFVAFGALAPDRAAEVLAGVHGADGVGVMGFEMLPHRDAHLQLVAGSGRPVILAGASVALAQRVAAEGSVPWLHTPDPSLVRDALHAELPAVVLEGHEAGGHVGPLPATALWEGCLAELEAAEHRPLLVLAGGLGDAPSAAFAAAMAADYHQAGGAVALQAGTAFFFTHELVESGQITAAYQEQALATEGTVLVGSSVDLPLRCAPNPFTLQAREQERRWRDEGLSRAERRQRLEHHNLGRTRVAAKGIERHPDWGRRADAPHYQPVPSRRQHDDGAFTLGQGAATHHDLRSVAEVVAALSDEAAALLDGRPRPPAVRAVHTPPPPRSSAAPTGARAPLDPLAPIAVVGLGAVLPGAHDVQGFWRNLLAGHDAVGPVPESRWRTGRYVGEQIDQSQTWLAGAVRGFSFDPLPFRIPPRTVPAMDRAQQLALVAARQAVQQAGWLRPGRIDPRRAAVILGNSMGGEHAKSLAVRIRYREVLAAIAADTLSQPWSDDEVLDLQERVAARLAEQLPPVDVESMAGLLGNVVSGRVASWLDWMGGNLTVDAACAASLAAVSVAVDWLRSGRVDAVLTGGVDADLSPETYVGFCRTHALSRRGSAPFSEHADGFVMAEGAAVFALMRLSDAVAQGVPVVAVIEGVGQASDGRSKGITAPREEGQRLALQRAWAEAGLSADQLGAVEAHGTGTALGDLTEIRGLARSVGDDGPPVFVGSVKSGLGHLKGAAGAVGLLRGVLSAHTGVAPPTLHAGPVRAELPLGRRLQLPRQPVPLPRPRVGVSAFGFGGTDFHVVVGPPPAEATPAVVVPPPVVGPSLDRWTADDAPPLVLCYGADSEEQLRARVAADEPVDPSAAHAWRLALLADPAGRAQAVQRAVRWLDTRGEAWRLGQQIVLDHGPPRPLVALCPGQGSQKPGALQRASRFLAAREALHALPPVDGTDSTGWEARADGDALAIHLALYAAQCAWAAVLHDARLPVAAWAGHSLGAFAALVGAGWLDAVHGQQLVAARGRALAACPPGGMVAVRGEAAAVAELASSCELSVAAHNGPSAWALAGPEVAVERLLAHHPEGVRVPVPRAYHSPMVQPAVDALHPLLAATSFAEGAPVWSTRSAQGVTPDTVADDLARAIADPVRFVDTVRALAAAHGGAPLFVECGPGDVLTRLVERCGHRSTALAGRSPHSEAWSAAVLFAAGHPQLLATLPGTLGRRAPSAVQPTPLERRSAVVTRPAPRVAAEPVATEPSPATPSAVGTVHQAVIDAICEVTGYPAEFLDDDADLADALGVDSIRRMEILGLLERRLGIAARESDYGALADADISGLVDWAEARLGDDSSSADDPAPQAVPSEGFVLVAPPRPPATPGPLPSLVDRYLRAHPALDLPAVRVAAAAAAQRCLQRAAGEAPEPAPVRVLAPAAAALPTEPTVVATGGATGIVARCLAALAPARVLLLGRREAPDTRELRAAGLQVAYARCDLRDADAVAAALAELPEGWAPPQVVLHGAGALRDGPLEEADDDDAAVVLGPKLLGAVHLSEALGEVALWVDFSSVVAHVGNPGQALYAAANAGLEALPIAASRRVSLAFTAWQEVGMASDPALQRLLASRGVAALTVRAGVDAFRAAVGSELQGPVLVWARPPSPPRPLLAPLGARRAFGADAAAWSMPLDPSDEALAHHVVAGRPLVPAALWVAGLLAAAADRHDGDWALLDLSVHAPTFVRSPRQATLELHARDDGLHDARVLVDGELVASARLQPAAPAPGPSPAPALDEGDDATPLYRHDLLFHGPSWQVLQRASLGAHEARATLRPANGQPRPAEVIDGIHQLLCAWSDAEQGFVSLPVGAGAWRAHGPLPSGPLAVRARPSLEQGDVVAQVRCLDADGRVVLSGDDVRLRRARRSHE